jgi:hypothetical protein
MKRALKGIVLPVVVVVVLSGALASCTFVWNLARTDTFSGSGGTIAGAGESEFPASVPIAGEIWEIKSVTLRGLVHPNSKELNIELQAPGMFTSSLSSYRGTGDQAFDGDYVFVDQGSDEGADTYLPLDGVIYPATYEASTDLSEFNNKDTLGTWKLIITNSGTSDGSLSDWSLELRYKRY